MKKLLFLLGIVVTTSISSFGYWFSESGWGPDFYYNEVVDFADVDGAPYDVWYTFYVLRNGSITDYTNKVESFAVFVYYGNDTFVDHAQAGGANKSEIVNGKVPRHVDEEIGTDPVHVSYAVTHIWAPLNGDYAYCYYFWYY